MRPVASRQLLGRGYLGRQSGIGEVVTKERNRCSLDPGLPSGSGPTLLPPQSSREPNEGHPGRSSVAIYLVVGSGLR